MWLFLAPDCCALLPSTALYCPSASLTFNAVHVCHVGDAHQAPHHDCSHESHAVCPQLRKEGLLGCLQGSSALHQKCMAWEGVRGSIQLLEQQQGTLQLQQGAGQSAQQAG